MSPFPNDKTTVLFLDTTPFFGPLMQVHSRVMKHLDRSRYRIVLAGIDAGDYADFLAEAPDVEVVRFGDATRPSRGRAGKLMRRMRPLLKGVHLVKLGLLARKERVRIVHVGMTQGMLVAGNIVSLISGARLVVHSHADPLKAGRSKRAFFRIGMKRASAVITVSSFIKERTVALGVPESRIHAVLNTVDLDRFNPSNDGTAIREEYGIPEDAPLVLCLGRLFTGKGQHYLLRAMGKLRDEYPDARTLIVGWEQAERGVPGSFRQLLHSIIRETGLEGRAIVADARPGAPQMMAAADIVAVPSTNDPCPLTVLEAMASGKPVVGFRSGGIPEELGEDDGVLVPVADEAGLADALRRLIADPGLRSTMGKRNRRRAESHFHESRLAHDVSLIYDNILGRTAGDGAHHAPDVSKTPTGERKAT